MRERAHSVLALLFVAVILIVPTFAAPVVATPGDPTTTTTSSSDELDAERIVELIDSGKAYAYAGEIEAWLVENSGRLSESQAATVYEWLLERAATTDIDTTALASVVRELPQDRARSVADRVQRSLSSAEVDAVAATLEGVSAEWSTQMAGWFGASTSSSSSSSTSTAPATGPNGYTVANLQAVGTQVSERPSIRRFGDGQLWLRYRTGGLLSTLRYMRPSTTVTVNEVRLGGFVGWDDAEIPDEVTVHVVAYETTRVNGSLVPTNVAERDTRVSLEEGYIGPDDRGVTVPVPVEHGESKQVALWIEGRRNQTQWSFRAAPSVASASVPSTTLAGRVGWAGLHIGGAFLVTSVTVLVSGAVAVRKLGVLPRTGILGWIIGGTSLIFWIPLFFFQDLANAFAQRPELLGVLLGLLVGLVGIRMLDDGLEKALFLQPRLSEDALEENADGREWWWANRVHKVTTREKDGKMIAPRTGWLGGLARLWPGYDAAPIIEFDGRRHKYARPDDLEDDGQEPATEGGYLERIRTRLGGFDDDDEFEHIFIIDPAADDVVVRETEGFEVSLPDDLVSWPEEGEGVRIRGVALPHVNLGKLIAGGAVMAFAGLFVSWLTTITLFGWMAALGVLTLFCVRPTDGWVRAVLSPGHGGHIIDTVWRTADEFKEAADKEYWKDRALSGEAEKRVEHADEVDDRKSTMFDETAERMAPSDSSPTSKNGKAPPASGDGGGGDE